MATVVVAGVDSAAGNSDGSDSVGAATGGPVGAAFGCRGRSARTDNGQRSDPSQNSEISSSCEGKEGVLSHTSVCRLFVESNAITTAGVHALGHEPVVGEAVWLAVSTQEDAQFTRPFFLGQDVGTRWFSPR